MRVARILTRCPGAVRADRRASSCIACIGLPGFACSQHIWTHTISGICDVVCMDRAWATLRRLRQGLHTRRRHDS